MLIAGAPNGIGKDTLLSKEFVRLAEGKMAKPLSPRIKEIAEGSFKEKQPPERSGYVVHSLEAVLWALYLTSTFKEGLLMVVNLGDDSDTTGAIYGQLAGAFYGLSSFQNHGLKKSSS